MCRRRRAAGPGVALNLTNASQGERFPYFNKQRTPQKVRRRTARRSSARAGGGSESVVDGWADNRRKSVHPQDGPLRPAVQWTKSKR
jgi:hypothetical protein